MIASSIFIEMSQWKCLNGNVSMDLKYLKEEDDTHEWTSAQCLRGGFAQFDEATSKMHHLFTQYDQVHAGIQT
ncbi:hypothetical protein [Candidatus Amarolinea dominans]|uniref:hypothetical protein n=1 Tax=Candidatus Amarolinea dominans TaxID=3140696 RepID=UPI0031CCD9A9